MDKALLENTEIIKNLDKWAHKIAERLMKTEFQCVPASVAALACVYAIQQMCDDKETVFDRSTMAKILAGNSQNPDSN